MRPKMLRVRANDSLISYSFFVIMELSQTLPNSTPEMMIVSANIWNKKKKVKAFA